MKYPVIPIRGGINIVPHGIKQIGIGRAISLSAAKAASDSDGMVVLLMQRDYAVDTPRAEDMYKRGVLARIMSFEEIQSVSEGKTRVKIISRVDIKEITQFEPYMEVEVDVVEDIPVVDFDREKVLRNMVLKAYDDYMENKGNEGGSNSRMFFDFSSGEMADRLAHTIRLSNFAIQSMINESDQLERLKMILAFLEDEHNKENIKRDIENEVKNSENIRSKRYHLQRELDIITKMLGETGEEASDIEEGEKTEAEKYREKLKTISLSKEYEEKILKEIKRFESISFDNIEKDKIRTYLDFVFALPWQEKSELEIDVKKSEKKLNADHYGLDKVKERILEYVSVMKLTDSVRTPIICLVGPPGTGKTSVAKSLAEALGREFQRISLGGVHDESVIRGHRRTYVGSVPGRIIDALIRAKVKNPLILLDEIEKMSASGNGDPAAALLEVLDPEQNSKFTDAFIDIPFDLSEVMFITTANYENYIPGPLRDRMEIIEIQGYSPNEKLEIAKKFLIPKQLKLHGLSNKNFKLNDGAINSLIEHYTAEAGVRNLEREIGGLVRKAARKIADQETDKVSITAKNIEEYAGKKKRTHDRIDSKKEIGVATGMGWSPIGGSSLTVEVSISNGSGKVELTGSLGDVMKESAKIAISHARANAKKYGIDESFYENKDIHIHWTNGAQPKDGPSAGVTMSVALISALTSTPVDKTVAMTGEVTLRGKITAIGGVKEKVLGAHRDGAKKILIPKDNERDIEDIPEDIREKLEFVIIETVSDALREALVK
ncbi:MAG: endopeptidase La [Eubacteriales bacterium]|nr:endopeptidase La [Eubacteriales bacterium]MDY3333122.1 endopeptidase La [Gallibacter sp.]